MSRVLVKSKKKIVGIGTAVLALLSVLFSGAGTKYLPEKSEIPFIGGVPSSQVEEKGVESDPRPTNTENLNMEGDLPYLSKRSILDGNLFIEQRYSNLVFGGANFEIVKFAVRTGEGEKAEILSLTSSYLSVSAYARPYVEFEYKGNVYALEVISKVVPPKDVELTYEISPLNQSTMVLRTYKQYRGT